MLSDSRHPNGAVPVIEPSPAFRILSPLYGAVILVRRGLYRSGVLRSDRAAVRTVCVGNVIAGGSGKSPVVQYLAAKLLEWGARPSIVLRGYGGEIRGPHLVSRSDSIAGVGDEALMHLELLNGRVPVIVARERKAGADLAATRADIAVLDDGFQHFALQRDLDLLVFDVSSPAAVRKWSAGGLLPGGWLREPLPAALRRAKGAILLHKGVGETAVTRDAAFEEAEKILRSRGFTGEAFRFVFTPSHLLDPRIGAVTPLDELRGREVLVVSALGDPSSFEESVSAIGASVAGRKRYPDHHRYTRAEAAEVLGQQRWVVTTAKDIVKLRPHLDAGAAPLRVLCAAAQPAGGDVESRLRVLVLGR